MDRKSMMTKGQDSDLPLDIVPKGREVVALPGFKFRARYFLVLLVPVFMFSGAVIGMYFQPPALKTFYALTGLKPGGGSSTPIALPPDVVLPKDMAETMRVTDVVGLARLMPLGDISIVAPPYGAGDARVSEILVAEGDVVTKGALLARLDNEAQLKGSVLLAEANLAVRQAALAQTRAAVENSRNEAEASLEQARSVAAKATIDFARAKKLASRGLTAQTVLEAAEAAEQQAVALVAKAAATLARFATIEVNEQPDVVVAIRNLAAAEAELAKAQNDVVRAAVLAPIAGTVLNIHVSPGQHPPAQGIMEIGNIAQMMAEAEVYQDRVSMVAKGQPVELAAAALGKTLQGQVVRIGLTVGRQGLVSDDTAANTDARVVKIMIELDAASSVIAAGFTNLEVIARIDTNPRITAKP